jgi:hypothetical protein
MATLTKIFTGMTGGPEAIQGNFEKLNAAGAVISEWTRTGMTNINGATDNTGWLLQYRTIDIDGQRFLQFSGWINAPKFNGSSQEVVQMPSNIFSGVTTLTSIGGFSLSGFDIIHVGYNGATNRLTFDNVSKTTAAVSCEINLIVTQAKNG